MVKLRVCCGVLRAVAIQLITLLDNKDTFSGRRDCGVGCRVLGDVIAPQAFDGTDLEYKLALFIFALKRKYPVSQIRLGEGG